VQRGELAVLSVDDIDVFYVFGRRLGSGLARAAFKAWVFVLLGFLYTRSIVIYFGSDNRCEISDFTFCYLFIALQISCDALTCRLAHRSRNVCEQAYMGQREIHPEEHCTNSVTAMEEEYARYKINDYQYYFSFNTASGLLPFRRLNVR
jgi:hypothetical protein